MGPTGLGKGCDQPNTGVISVPRCAHEAISVAIESIGDPLLPKMEQVIVPSMVRGAHATDDGQGETSAPDPLW